MTRSPYAVAALGVAAAAGAALLLWVTLWGPGALPEEYPPTGIDGLTVPTPSPDPTDFVDVVDNPWLPYLPGATWTYRTDTGERVTVAVRTEPVQVAGVATTAVDQQVTGPGGRAAELTRLLVAQDTDGNVWSFGADTADGSWRAGAGGAQAGLLMPAAPRTGDGFRPGLAPGLDAVLTVVSVADPVAVPAGEWDEAVVLRRTEDGDAVATTWYVRGTGPVLVTSSGSGQRLELVAGAAAR